MNQEMANFIYSGLINMHRFMLKQLPHGKKYFTIRRLHSEVLESMIKYFNTDKFDASKNFAIMANATCKKGYEKDIFLSMDNEADTSILLELFFYKNHSKVKSITEIFLETHRFKAEKKVKMLEAMRDSYASLFVIKDIDSNNEYVTFEDVFTHKKYKVVDVSLSMPNREKIIDKVYFYNRIITYEGISFTTAIRCVIQSDNKEVKKFIKKHKYNQNHPCIRCLRLYDISRQCNNKIGIYTPV